MPDLTKDEYNALISLPGFQEALKAVREAKAAKEAQRIKDSGLCEGADPIREKTGLKCPKCGLFLEYTDNSNENKNNGILMAGRHWNRPDRPNANPFTSNGMYGKAAGGDWYMDH